MAEKEVSPQGDVTANRPTPPEVVIEDSVGDIIRKAPKPSSKARKSYRCMYPTDQFIMAEMPVITTKGTPLTDEQFKAVAPVAEASGVRIVEVSD